jgi:nitrite reductase/ring-hydroxylating ferredoxin subunit
LRKIEKVPVAMRDLAWPTLDNSLHLRGKECCWHALSQGTLSSDCLLTCNWHNWKFDLTAGEALVGRNPVRIIR